MSTEETSASLPPMGWMSWLRFLCEVDCQTHPTACISEELYRSSADALVAGGFADAGYNDFDINLTRLSSVASTNADSTITTVPCRVLCILLHALFA